MGGFEDAIRDTLKLSDEERHKLLSSLSSPIFLNGKKLTRLEEVIHSSSSDFMLDLRNLLHELKYCRTADDFTKLTSEKPIEGLTEHKLQYVFIAGVVEFYALWHKWDIPNWVLDSKYTLDEPWWASDSEEIRNIIKKTVPECLSRRGIFTEESALVPW